MSFIKSTYDQFSLFSRDLSKQVEIADGVFAFDYYEDIFSPTITAKVRVFNTQDSVVNDGIPQSIYNGLPLRGGERVRVKVAPNSQFNPGLDFSTSEREFYVSGITDVYEETRKESFTLNLVSKESIVSEVTKVGRRFSPDTSISDSVTAILRDYLKTPNFQESNIEKTSNSYGFIGNLRKPFTILTWLASRAVPEKSGSATAGYVFYQTQDGFNFKSIESLISQEPKATYYYTEVNLQFNSEDQKVNNDFNILSYTINKNQNYVDNLRLGTYSSWRMLFDPLTFSFVQPEQGIFKVGDYNGRVDNLGQPITLPEVPQVSNQQNIGNLPSRILSGVFDRGSISKGVSTEINQNQLEYQSQSLTRYNTLLVQSINMMVSLNTNLRAGEVIECFFPEIKNTDARQFDPETSGKYIIKELCHHFDTTRSYTSLKLVRDTFGRSNT